MRIIPVRIIPIVLLSAFCVEASSQTVTLFPPYNPDTKTYDRSRAWLSFKDGSVKESTKNDWDLGYGFLAINHQDWFILHNSNENRSVIKDLGKRKWEDHSTVPVLEPLPVLPTGERRKITIDTSAGKPLSEQERQDQEEGRRMASEDPFEAQFERETRRNTERVDQAQYDTQYGAKLPMPEPISPGAKWAKTTNTFAKVTLDHIYLLHVKNQVDDFYVLFRVEDFEQHNHCTISWRFASPSKLAKKP
jgi:hypothetical protein